MRILNLTIKNLNSIKGKWSIDFNDPQFTGTGLFAITGPTGAGKTTILDGMCLALYGQTPRLGKITKSSNEIMSRHTSECMAELTFETHKGTFRAFWGQRRARGKLSGELQAPVHELIDHKTGTVIEAKRTLVLQTIENITGMAFDQFTRSILLAQGDFAAFLHASADERAPLLEQITGSAIYGEISMEVHQRLSAEKKRADSFQMELDAIPILSDDELAHLTATKNQLQQRQLILQNHQKETGDLIEHHTQLQRLSAEIKTIETQLATIGQQKEQEAERYQQLHRAKIAAAYATQYRNLTEQKQLLCRHTVERDNLKKQKVELETAIVAAETQRQKLEQSRTKTTQQFDDLKPKLAATRTLDVKITERHQSVDQLKAELEKLAISQKHADETATHLNQKIAKLTRQMGEGERYLKTHASDQKLVEDLPAIQEINESKNKTLALIRDKEQAITRHRDSIERLKRNRHQFTTELIGHQKLMTAEQQALSSYQQEKDALLAGKPLEQWRHHLQKLESTKHSLQQLIEFTNQYQQAEQVMTNVKRQIDSIEQKKNVNKLSVDQSSQLIVAKAALIQQLEKERELTHKIKSLEEERKALQDGAPCPLCGSPEHPYNQQQNSGAASSPDFSHDKIKALQTERETLSQAVAQINGENKWMDQRLKELDTEMTEANNKQQIALAGMKQYKTLVQENLDPSLETRPLLSPTEHLTQTQKAIEHAQTTVDKYLKLTATGKTLEEKIGKLERQSNHLENNIKSIDSELDYMNQQTTVLTTDSQYFADELAAVELKLQNLLAPYALPTTQTQPQTQTQTQTQNENTLSLLLQRRDSFLSHQKNVNSLQTQLAEDHSRQERNNLMVQQTAQARAETKQKYRTQETQLSSLRQERHQLLSDSDPDTLDQHYQTQLKKLDAEYDKARAAIADKQQQLAWPLEQSKKLDKSITELTQTIEQLTLDLTAEITQNTPFDDLDKLAAALLNHQQLSELEASLEKIDREEAKVKALLKSSTTKRQELLANTIDLPPLKDLQSNQQKTAEERDQLNQQLGKIDQEVKRHTSNTLARQDKLSTYQKQAAEVARWERLHRLIGSADGKKFRNFAQGITFDRVIQCANVQLEKLTDRYSLQRNHTGQLELAVIDHYQGDILRPTKNLSGGESFLISLALALGLSHMSSRKVQVNSLFLDEGFGTLDEESLDMALDTLMGLHQEGKLIGVISHIPALKERIHCQIVLNKKTNGAGELSGPGIHNVAD